MQKKNSNGLFIDSSVRRAGLLKTLLRGLRGERAEEEDVKSAFRQNDRAFPAPGTAEIHDKGDNTCMKRAASL